MLSGSHSAIIASIIAACVNAAAIASLEPMPPKLYTRVLQHVYDAGHFLGLGLLCAGLCAIHAALGRRRSVAWVGLFLVVLAVSVAVLPADLQNACARYAEGRGAWAYPTFLSAGVALCALTVPVAWGLGRLVARRWIRWIGVLLSVAAFGANAVLLPADYRAIHLFAALVAGALLGSALVGAEPPRRVASAFRRLRFLAVPARAVGAVAAAVTLVAAPPPTVSAALIASEGSVLQPFLGALHEDLRAEEPHLTPGQEPWFTSRVSAPPVPATEPSVLPPSPIILMFSIDGIREEVLRSGKYDKTLPVLSGLRARSVWFRNARSPGSGTAHTLSSIFMGTYYCQQYWSTMEGNRALWPHADPTVRFPELLQKIGVSTVTYASAPWLVGSFGVVRGFAEETYVKRSRTYYTHSQPIVDRILPRLESQGPEPLFLFVHFLDPHAPYDLSSVKGPDFNRYVGEIGVVDAQIGRIMRLVESSALAARTSVIILSDHGEAFGEHGRRTHQNSVYEELLRVPLFMMIPNVKPRVVDDPVSLIDLGPTILDMFHQPTPGYFMGQSLQGHLRGEPSLLTRPIMAETRLMRALITPQKMKVIVDDRVHSVELYDLKTDPGELRNLADDDALLQEPLAQLRKLLDVHTIVRPGYKPPYRQ